MSRGLGRIQRAILNHLATEGSDVSLHRLTGIVFGTDDPNDSQRASVRRAAWKLYHAGLAGMSEPTAPLQRDPDGRFYLRQRRAERHGLQRVPIAERFVYGAPPPEEAERQAASLKRLMAIERRIS